MNLVLHHMKWFCFSDGTLSDQASVKPPESVISKLCLSIKAHNTLCCTLMMDKSLSH